MFFSFTSSLSPAGKTASISFNTIPMIILHSFSIGFRLRKLLLYNKVSSTLHEEPSVLRQSVSVWWRTFLYGKKVSSTLHEEPSVLRQFMELPADANTNSPPTQFLFYHRLSVSARKLVNFFFTLWLGLLTAYSLCMQAGLTSYYGSQP